MLSVIRFFPRSPRWRAGLLCLPLLILAAAGCGRNAKVVSRNPLVVTPVLAVRALQAQSLFYNAQAKVWLLQEKIALVPPEDRQPDAPRPRAYAQAVQNPKLFRQLDRQFRFDTLLLSGDPSQYRPLLEHLQESKDFHLAYLDHTSLVFRREGPAWEPAALAQVRAQLPGLSAREEALVLSQMAAKLIALRRMEPARTLLTEAEQKDAKLPEVISTWGQYHLNLGDWKAAESAADRALALDPQSLGGLSVKAQTLYSTKRFAEAYRYSGELVKLRPDDPGILFYHAKIAHEAKQFTAEIEAMEHLVSLAIKSGRVDPGYRVYLGQAFAANGEAEPALANFALALADPDLPEEQRKFAEETSALIRQKVAAPKP